ncbi:MAG: cyclase family protein [Acidimicrobiales bacterium]|nr:cyclase family protein [Acidimicrobiales bacterium]
MSFNDHFHAVAAEVRNWGRWGADDRLGTLNLLTDEAVAAGAATIRSGRRVPCAIDLSPNGPQIGSVPGRINPLRGMNYINNADLGDPDGNAMVPHFNDDHVVMGLQAGTHWDGLGHVSYDHHLYNGVPADSVTALGGSTVLGIENVRTLVGRGVLLDVAAMHQAEQLPGGHEITGEELDETAEWAGVEIRSGDIVLIRSGRIRSFHAGGGLAYIMGPAGDASNPGPGLDACRWFHRNDVAAVADDIMTFEVFPGPEPENMLAVHCLAIVDMGLTTGQIWDLEALSAACADESRYEFFLAANPEPFVGGCGAPVSPVAVF